MEYFLINLSISIIFILLMIGRDSIEKVAIYYFVGFLFILFLGLRGSNDEYTQLFINTPVLSTFLSNISIGLERGLGFTFIASSLQSLGLSSQWLLFIFALSSVGIRLKYFYKFSDYYLLAFLFYLSHEVIFHEYWQIRQGLSSAMVLPMIYHLQNNNKRMFFLFYFISSLIHYAGILSIILLLINKKISIKWLSISICFAFILNFSNLIGASLSFLSDSGYLPLVIENYIGWDLRYYELGLFHPKTFQQILTSILILFILRESNSYYTKSISPLIINTYILSTLLQIAFNNQAVFATRLGGHFYVVEPIAITYFLGWVKEKKSLLTLATFACIILSYINYIIRPELQPYKLLVQ